MVPYRSAGGRGLAGSVHFRQDGGNGVGDYHLSMYYDLWSISPGKESDFTCIRNSGVPPLPSSVRRWGAHCLVRLPTYFQCVSWCHPLIRALAARTYATLILFAQLSTMDVAVPDEVTPLMRSPSIYIPNPWWWCSIRSPAEVRTTVNPWLTLRNSSGRPTLPTQLLRASSVRVTMGDV